MFHLTLIEIDMPLDSLSHLFSILVKCRSFGLTYSKDVVEADNTETNIMTSTEALAQELRAHRR